MRPSVALLALLLTLPLAAPPALADDTDDADLVVLDGDEPALAGHGDTVLDAAIFGPCRAPVRHAMLRGRWAVRDGRHRDEDEVRARYLRAMARLANGSP